MPQKNFYIISDKKKDKSFEGAQEIKRYLENEGCCVRIVGVSETIREHSWAQMVIVLGGDGTVIQAAKRFAGKNVPILGINFGTLGFLTEVERPKLQTALEDILNGKYMVEKRMAMIGNRLSTVDFDETKIGTGRAINEFIIGKEDFGHMITISVYVNDYLLDTYVADAVLVSTPTGSTAYNLSAAGPVLAPDMEAFVITPVCPHSLNKRSIVVSADSKICIKIGRTKKYSDDKAMVRADGNMLWRISTGDIINITKAQETIDMVRFGDVGFFERMRNKLNREV